MTEYFYGIVEDRHDPMMIGRVRVRVHGIHTDDKNAIATPDLPWAQVILPTTATDTHGDQRRGVRPPQQRVRPAWQRARSPRQSPGSGRGVTPGAFSR